MMVTFYLKFWRNGFNFLPGFFIRKLPAYGFTQA
jgi:hypothetical protein